MAHRLIHFMQVADDDRTERSWGELVLRLAQIMEFIGQCIEQNRKLLICCDRGVSTGPVALIAYLLLKARFRIQTSLEHLQRIRREVKPSLSLWKGLEELEDSLSQKKLNRFDIRMKDCALYDLE